MFPTGDASYPPAHQGKTAGTPRLGCKHAKTGLQAHQDWAASTSGLGSKHVKTRQKARQDQAASTSGPGSKHALWEKGVFRTPKRSTLHKPAQHAPSAIAARCISHHTALRFPTGCGAAGRPSPLPFPYNRKRGWRQVVRKWQQAVARPRKKFYLCPCRTLQTEKDR